MRSETCRNIRFLCSFESGGVVGAASKEASGLGAVTVKATEELSPLVGTVNPNEGLVDSSWLFSLLAPSELDSSVRESF